MKMNPLLSEVLRGQWFIDVNNIAAYDQFLISLLQGKTIPFNKEAKEASLFGVLDGNGRLLRGNEEGIVTVPKNSIAQVNVQGEIIKYGDYCIYGADDIVDALDRAQDNSNVDATVMRIEGPGGSVAAIDTFREFKRRKVKPIVGLVSNALSLHYWIAAELCDYIISDGDVSPMFGSIGVKASFLDRKKQLEMMGLEQIEINAPESEHKNLPFELAQKGDYSLIKTEMLSPLAIHFQNVVKENRPNLITTEVGLLTGKTFYAKDALRLGLIDDIGDIGTAIDKARGLALSYQVNKSLK